MSKSKLHKNVDVCSSNLIEDCELQGDKLKIGYVYQCVKSDTSPSYTQGIILGDLVLALNFPTKSNVLLNLRNMTVFDNTGMMLYSIRPDIDLVKLKLPIYE